MNNYKIIIIHYIEKKKSYSDIASSLLCNYKMHVNLILRFFF